MEQVWRFLELWEIVEILQSMKTKITYSHKKKKKKLVTIQLEDQDSGMPPWLLGCMSDKSE